MKKVGVILSGCGVYDGSEIHEAVLTILSLDKRNVEVIILAPNIEQTHVVNHLTGELSKEKRNVLIEAARIARGKIHDIKGFNPRYLDALVIPGGFGAAKNLCNYAIKGSDFDVNKDVLEFLTVIIENKIPLAAICIAPILLSKVFEKLNKAVELTIGNDASTSKTISNMGNTHFKCSVKEFHVDKNNKIISTPAYMLGQRISEIAEGIDNTIEALINLI